MWRQAAGLQVVAILKQLQLIRLSPNDEPVVRAGE